jgi:hypothetical protein
MGMECVVFMGEEDTIRQALNVYRMRLLGAQVIPVKSGTATLKDAVSEAMREWTSRISDTHYCLGSVMGPHPFPTIVRDFQAVISKEIKEQMLEKEGRLPDAVLAHILPQEQLPQKLIPSSGQLLLHSGDFFQLGFVGSLVSLFHISQPPAFCGEKLFQLLHPLKQRLVFAFSHNDFLSNFVTVRHKVAVLRLSDGSSQSY